jgi:hypothetical protein
MKTWPVPVELPLLGFVAVAGAAVASAAARAATDTLAMMDMRVLRVELTSSLPSWLRLELGVSGKSQRDSGSGLVLESIRLPRRCLETDLKQHECQKAYCKESFERVLSKL